MKVDFEFEDLVKLLRKNKKTIGCEIGETTNLVNDLGFDSLDIMQLLISIESKLDMTFSINDLDMENIIKVKELYTFIKTKK